MRWAIYLGWLAILAGIGGTGYGVWAVFGQHQRIARANPVPALVLSQRTEERKLNHNKVNVPIIEYEYQVNGQQFKSETVTPVECMLPNSWADEVLQKYPVGAQVQAFYDPGQPDRAFLVPKYGGEPYIAVLVSICIAAMGIGAIVEQKMNSHSPTAVEMNINGTHLSAKRHHLANARLYATLGVVGFAAGLPTILHHISVSTPPHERLAFLLEGCFAIAVLVVFVLAFSGYRRGRGFGSPDVQINRTHVRLGGQFQLSVVLPTYFHGRVRKLTGQIECVAVDQAWFSFSEESADKSLFVQSLIFAVNAEAKSGGQVTGSAAVTLPEDAAPSTLPDDPAKMHVVWSLKLLAEGDGAARLESTYIFLVES